MTVTLARPRSSNVGSAQPPRSRLKRRLDPWLVSGFTGMVLFLFLLPLGYMLVTSLKSEQMITNLEAPLLPMRPATLEYEGEALDVYVVPLPDGSVRELALVQPRRQESLFVDPSDPNAGVLAWSGNWRTLQPANALDPRWDNYADAWELMDFPLVLRNTMVIAGVGTLGAVASSILVAYGLARFRVPFARSIMVVLIATIILPKFATLVPTYALFVQIGWVGTWLPLIVPHFFANAFNVFLLRQYFLTIPRELDEAAIIDGAGPLRTLWWVILPQMVPAVVAVCLFHFYFAWNDFFEPMIYLSTRPDLQPISVALRTFNTLYDSRPNLIQAGAMLALVIPVVLFLFAQKAFLKGIDLSGVRK